MITLINRSNAHGSLPWVCRCTFILAAFLPVPSSYSQQVRSSHVDWHYGAFLDTSYALDFNFPANHRWRSKSTTPRVNEFAPNMALAYVRKDVTHDSPWGMEFGIQGGYDTNGLVPQPVSDRERPVSGADTLRHFSRANISYLIPVGRGLTVTAGQFNSYIGYQSLYSKYNLNYTRSYMADNAPYIMFGLQARYSVNDNLVIGLYAINGYTYLSHINDQLSYGTQIAWKIHPDLTFTENFYYGPDQAHTALEFWRFFSDSILEWQRKQLILAVAYDFGTEQAAEQIGNPRTFWTGAALFARWNIHGPWSVAIRPEVYWDRDGRITGSQQLLKAMTATLEYHLVNGWSSALLRLEYRYDESTGRDAGFFKGGEVAPGMIGLARDQQLLIASIVCSFDR